MFRRPDHKYEHRRMTRHIDIVIIRAISVHSLIVIISTLDDNINPTSLFSLALQLFVPEPGSDDISYLRTLVNLDWIDFLVFGPQGRVWILFWQIGDSRSVEQHVKS